MWAVRVAELPVREFDWRRPQPRVGMTNPNATMNATVLCTIKRQSTLKTGEHTKIVEGLVPSSCFVCDRVTLPLLVKTFPSGQTEAQWHHPQCSRSLTCAAERRTTTRPPFKKGRGALNKAMDD